MFTDKTLKLKTEKLIRRLRTKQQLLVFHENSNQEGFIPEETLKIDTNWTPIGKSETLSKKFRSSPVSNAVGLGIEVCY